MGNITKYELERPDSDGDCEIGLEFSVTNDTDEDIFLVRHDAFHFDGNGYLIEADMRNSEDCFLEPGDEVNLSGWGRINEKFLKDSEEASVKVLARLFSREFFKFGPFPTPAPGEVGYVHADVQSTVIRNNIKICVATDVPDDDGDVRIDIMCSLENLSEHFLEMPELSVRLLDRSGAEIESISDSNDTPARAISQLRPSTWGNKAKKIKGGTMEFELKVYKPVSVQMSESSIKLS